MKANWQMVAIEDVSQVVNGGTPKTQVSEYWGGNHLWITPAEMGNHISPYLGESRRTLTDAGLNSSSATLVPPKSVILSTRAPIGHLVINIEPMAFNQGCRAIIPGKNLHYKFLYYFLHSNVKRLNQMGAGTTFKELAAGKLKKFSMPLPVISEQKRIVAILDEAFAGIDKAIANTEKNLANTGELFESYLDVLFSRSNKDSERGPLIDFVDSISTGPFGSLLHKSDYLDDGVPLVNPINIVGSEIKPDNKKRINKETKKRLKQYVLKSGDLVVARRGDIGRCAVVKEEQDGWICGTGCFFIRTNNKTNPYFLTTMLRSPVYRKELESRSSGTTMLNLSNKTLANLPISVPERKVQDEVVGQIFELSVRYREIRSNYERKARALAELKQSILNKAFSGELPFEFREKITDEAVA